jgi:hypothetical protein
MILAEALLESSKNEAYLEIDKEKSLIVKIDVTGKRKYKIVTDKKRFVSDNSLWYPI